MILMMTLYLLRMIFCGVLAAFAPFWFAVALIGAWLIRAELAALCCPGGSQAWIQVPRGLGKHHWYLAAGAMIAIGFLHPFGILLAFTVSWAVASLETMLCLDSISGITPKAYNTLGYFSELLLMFLGILFYAAV